MKHNTVDQAPPREIVRNPNALMNDYTKNISSSIFTPGVHRTPGGRATGELRKHFRTSK